MAAIFKLRRGTSPSPALTDGELFLNYTTSTIQFSSGSVVSNLLPLGKSITGNINLDGNITASNLTLSGDANINGNIILGGNITLGDSGSDEIQLNASLSGSLIPDSGSVYDIGSSTRKYKNLYVDSASIDNVTLNGSGIVSSSQQIDDLGFLKVLGDSVVSGSEQIVDVLTSVNSYTASNDTTNTTQNSRLDQLSTETGSISTEQTAQDNRLTALETETGSIDTTQTAQDNRLDSIEAATGSYLTSTGSVDFEDITSKPTLVSGSSQITYGDISSIPTNIVSSSTDSSTVNFTISNGIVTADLIGGVVSGSSQITITESQISDLSHTDISLLNSYTASNDINIDNIHSTTASFESRLDLLSNVSHSHSNKTELDTINQNLSTTSDVTFNTGSFTGNMTITGDLTVLGSSTEISSTELRIEDKLITVASGSADSAAADGAGLEIDGAGKSLKWDHNTSQFVLDAKVSSSVGFKGEGGELTGIDTDQVTEAGNLYYTDIRVKTKLDTDDIHSGSYLGTATTSNLDEGSNLYYTEARVSSSLNNRGVLSGSFQVLDILSSLNSYTSSNNDTITNIESTTSSFEDRLDNIEAETGSYLTSSGSVDFDDITGKPSLVSGSSQIDFDNLDNLPAGLISGSSQVDADNITNFDSNVKSKLNSDGVISGSTFQSNHQGAFTSSVNGTDTNIDLGLEEGDSPTFSGLSLTNLSYVGSGNQTALMSGSNGIINVRTLGSAAFFNVSSSVADDPNSIPTNAAVDAALVAAGAGDITAVNDTSLYSSANTGIKHTTQGTETSGEYGQQGNIVLAIDTGSSHFQAGVELYSSTLPSGVLSGSSQVVDVLNTEGVHSGSFLGTATTSNLGEGTNLYYTDTRVSTRTDTILNHSNHTNISISKVGNELRLSGVASYTDADTLDYINSLEVISGSSQINYSELSGINNNIISASSDTSQVDMIINGGSISANLKGGVVSGSSQVIDILSSINTYTSSNDNDIPELFSSASDHEGRIDTLEGDVHEDPLTFNDTTNVDLIRSGDVITANLKGGVVSGSSQVNFTELSGISNNIISSSSDTANVDMIINGGSISANLKGGVVSGSSQITFADLNGLPGGIVSGSSQLTSSYDTRYVNATGNESIGGNKTFDNNVVISGDLNVAGTTTYTSTNNVNIGDNILELNFGGSATTSGLLTKDATGGSTTSGSLLWDATNDYWKAGKIGSEAKILLSLGDGVVSGSDQITKTLQEVTTAGNTTSNTVSITNSTASTTKTTGALVVTGGVGVSGAVNVGGDVVAYASSDRRLKEEITPISNPLEKINQISGNSFIWNEEKQNIYKGKDYGVIAQEIEEILPELVDTREDGYKAVKYDKIVSLLIEGIKELSIEVAKLKKETGK